MSTATLRSLMRPGEEDKIFDGALDFTIDLCADSVAHDLLLFALAHTPNNLEQMSYAAGACIAGNYLERTRLDATAMWDVLRNPDFWGKGEPFESRPVPQHFLEVKEYLFTKRPNAIPHEYLHDVRVQWRIGVACGAAASLIVASIVKFAESKLPKVNTRHLRTELN